MVSLRVALEEITKNSVMSVKWCLLGVKWRSYHPLVGIFASLIQVVVHHQILPTSTKRNVWGPVGRIFMLTIEFIDNRIHRNILPTSTIKTLYRAVRSIFTLILMLLHILTFFRSFSVLCSLFSCSNFCLMRSRCFSWASCSAFNYDKNIYNTRKM